MVFFIKFATIQSIHQSIELLFHRLAVRLHFEYAVVANFAKGVPNRATLANSSQHFSYMEERRLKRGETLLSQHLSYLENEVVYGSTRKE